MTIGEKIKYLRKCLNITQNNLADRANIHPVSIRKYETNKMKPKPTQIEKLAKALNASSFALIENYDNLKCCSLGDLYSILILLYKFGFIEFNASKVDNNIDIQINSRVSELFDLKNFENGKSEIINQHTFSISAGQKLKGTSSYDKFLDWIKRCKELESFKDSLSSPTTETAKETINMFQEKNEILELELQQSTELLKDL